MQPFGMNEKLTNNMKMKRFFTTCLFMAMVMTMMAVPAKRGVWKTLTLQDGTEVRAMLVGDEHGHFWRAADGQAYLEEAGTAYYKVADAKQIAAKAKTRRQQANAKFAKRRTFGHPTTIMGTKKAIMILVNFSDKAYRLGHDNALFQKIANQENYNEGKFKGSMADYFKAQSRGKFELDFDVVGPVTVSKTASYYGSNNSQGDDLYPEEMVKEAVTLAKNEISDWTPYDWDNDGYVDQVYVVYAGKGEADGGDDDTIWPHAWELGYDAVTVGTNLKVNSYACGPELDGQTGDITGIGVMCHEYSHCLGYPDFYDIDYSGGQGMGEWDLMDAGSYNGDGYQPAGYTSYERWFAGWEQPIELKAEDVAVTNMKSLQNGGEFYIIYNDKNADEYYLLENRQFEGWDASQYYAGLLILHCDYDGSIWESNEPNNDPKHQRMTVVPADGEFTYSMYQGTKYYDPAETFPLEGINAFNKDFKTKDTQAKKAAQFFTKTSNGTNWMNGSIEAITQNADGTISFNYVAQYAGNGNGNGNTNTDGALFCETFDECNGTGGNDDSWSGNIAKGEFNPDNDGWTAGGDKAYGAYQCAKFGTGDVNGSATTPTISLSGETKLTFRAGAWNSTKDSQTLLLSVSGGTISPESVTMTKGDFTEFEATVTGNGAITITFESQKGRFFLDDVVVIDPNATAINDATIRTTPNAQRNAVYDLQGRRVKASQLKSGLYIIDGKKVFIR